MKNLLLLAVLILFVGCSKDEETEKRNVDCDLVGNWYDVSAYTSNGDINELPQTYENQQQADLKYSSISNSDDVITSTLRIFFESEGTNVYRSEDCGSFAVYLTEELPAIEEHTNVIKKDGDLMMTEWKGVYRIVYRE